MKNCYPKLTPGAYYHIYNRGNNRETIFHTDENYRYFLGKYAKYLQPVLDTYAYCLLPNHFHLVARVKTLAEIVAGRPGGNFPGFQNLESLDDDRLGLLVSNQFRLCFMSYAKAFNKQYDRTGSLFQKNFKRLPVQNMDYFANLILYVHANPQLHGIWDDYRAWPHSSYLAMLSDDTTRLQRKETLEMFGGKEGFSEAHQHYIDLKIIDHLMIED